MLLWRSFACLRSSTSPVLQTSHWSRPAGTLPLVEALHDKGLPMGTVLAFMMSVVALSTPEMILLRRVLKEQLIATYVGVGAVGILVTGYLFNLVI